MSDELPDDPRELVQVLLSPHIKDGKLNFAKRDLDADRIKDRLNISLSSEEPRVFQINDTQAIQLVESAITNRNVAEYAALIAATNLRGYGPLPPALRFFASMKLVDASPAGRKGRKRGDNYERDRWIMWVVGWLVSKT